MKQYDINNPPPLDLLSLYDFDELMDTIISRKLAHLYRDGFITEYQQTNFWQAVNIRDESLEKLELIILETLIKEEKRK